MCAQHVRLALAAPLIHAPDATAAYMKTPPVQVKYQHPAPRGTIHYWTGGAAGHGHVALALGDGRVASVDVNGSRTVGIVPLGWFGTHWPNLKYKGWSWYWGPLNTQPKEDAVATWPAVGSSKVLEPSDKVLKDGVYGEVGRIDLPKGGKFLLTLQGRLPQGSWARVEFQRVGWGNDPDGRDQTGSTPWLPAPDGKATSYTHNHEIGGGGPVAYMIKPYGPGDTTKVVSLVVKALRLS